MLAPLVGGAMTLAGGAMSMTGGLVHAGATATGMAWDMGKGVASAAGGLLGGGESGNKEKPEVKKTPSGTYRDAKGILRHDGTAKKRGTYASDPAKGMSLANVKSSLALGNAEGAVTPLAGDWKETMLSLVKAISVNTSRTAEGMSMLITGMTAQATQSATQTATDKRDENLAGAETGGGKGPGRIASGISKGWGKVKDTLSSVGSGLKMALKAIALFGIFTLYKKYRENIKEWMANIFETFDYWYHEVKESESPFKTAWDGIKTMATDSWVWLKEKAALFIDWLWDMLKVFINDKLGMELFDVQKDRAISRGAVALTEASGNLGMTLMDADLRPDELGTVKFKPATNQFGYGLNGQDVPTALQGKEGLQNTISNDARAMLQEMWNISKRSDFRVQWTKLGFPMKPGGLFASFGTYEEPDIKVSDIMQAQPILDNKIITRAMLDREGRGPGLDALAGVTSMSDPENVAKIKENLAIIAEYTRLMEMGETGRKEGFFSSIGIGKDVVFETEIERLLNENQQTWLANPKLMDEYLKQTEIKIDKKLPINKTETLKSWSSPGPGVYATPPTVPIIAQSDNRNQSVTKLGDSYSGGLSSRVQESTAQMLAYTKNLNSTTGQFA